MKFYRKTDLLITLATVVIHVHDNLAKIAHIDIL